MRPALRAPTSGRLVTTVTQGAAAFDPALGSLPAVDDTQRAEAWGIAAEAAGPVDAVSRALSTSDSCATKLLARARSRGSARSCASAG